MRKPPLEKDIQASILLYLKLRGIFHYKNSTVGIYNAKTGKYIPSQSVGAPDIVVIERGGRYVGIEVKRPGQKLSEHQRAFKEQIEKAGGRYITASYISDVEDIK